MFTQHLSLPSWAGCLYRMGSEVWPWLYPKAFWEPPSMEVCVAGSLLFPPICSFRAEATLAGYSRDDQGRVGFPLHRGDLFHLECVSHCTKTRNCWAVRQGRNEEMLARGADTGGEGNTWEMETLALRTSSAWLNSGEALHCAYSTGN